ncbi:tetratricopeptide repeat protein [Nonomuraea rubra]|uniref:tetratricopeptide repeat protein n=1 Tax=Nonomuraea rubra TaxID=46180 RepID=UPI003619DCAC
MGGEGPAPSFLGWVYRDLDRYDAAIAELVTALGDWDRAGLPQRKVGALNNLGIVHTIVGRLDEALGYLESALELTDNVGRPGAAATIRNNRVHVYYRQGRFDEAIAEARRLVELVPQGVRSPKPASPTARWATSTVMPAGHRRRWRATRRPCGCSTSRATA